MDYKEFQELIHNVNEENKATIENKFNVIDIKLSHILEQTTKTNGRVTALEKDVNALKINEINHIINCPIKPKLEVIEKEVNKSTNVKSFLIKTVAVTGSIIASTVSILKIMEYIK